MIGLAWLYLFWPLITGQKVVGFRDAANLYYPLFEWIDAQWAKGEFPVWNPFCNFGMPVVHDGSSSLFYPGKLIFFVRQLPYPARYGLYLAIHILIAAGGTYWFSRTLRLTRSGSTLAAFSYAFGGAVLFQVVNAPFVVSAAWLPFALGSVWLTFRQLKMKWAVLTALYCSLMILGGDPQMCYHVGLIMCAFAIHTIWRTYKRRKRRKQVNRNASESWRQSFFKTSLVSATFVLITVVVTFGLSAVQVLPSYVWSKQSIRTHTEHPRTLTEWILSAQGKEEGKEGTDDWQAFVATVLNEPADTKHQNHAYQFSQPPWTIGELVWGNVSGRAYPVHQRWVDGLAGAERMWTPSLYAGGFVFVLALITLNPFSRSRKVAWLTRLFLFFAIASFGWYGLVWLGRELNLIGADSELGSAVGGLYWFMVVGLPKYISFRYPAKLFTVAALALSVLAGWRLGNLIRTSKQPHNLTTLRRVCVGIGVGSVLIMLFSEPIARVGKLTNSVLFGPFDLEGCQKGLCISAASTLFLLIACYVLLKLGSRFWRVRNFIAGLLVGLCSVELFLANAWLVPAIDASVFQSPASFDGFSTVSNWKVGTPAHDPKQDDQQPTSASSTLTAPIQNVVPDGLPDEFFDTSSKQRLAEIVQWQRDSLAPKFHLQHELHLFNSFASLEPVLPNSNSFGVPVALDRETNKFKVSQAANKINFYQDLFLRRATSAPNLVAEISRVALNKYEIDLETKIDKEEIVVMLQTVPGWQATATSQTTGEQFELDVSYSTTTHKKPTQQKYGIRFNLPAPDSYKVELAYKPQELTVGIWGSAISWILLVMFFVVQPNSDKSERG